MIPHHKGEIPVVLLLLFFLPGIVFGFGFFPNINVAWLTAIFIFLSFVFIVCNLNYNKFQLYKHRWIGGALISTILFVFGWIIVLNHNELRVKNHFSKTPAQHLVVKITNEPALKNGLVRFTADVEESINNGETSKTSGTLLVSIKESLARNLCYGDILLIPASYNPIDPPFNPAEFNYKKYLADKNIFYQAFLYPKQFVRLKTNAGNPLISGVLQLRRHLVEKLKLNLRDTNAVAVASTLILGYRAGLSNDVLQAYSKTGTLYVLTVSGAQVAIVYILLAFSLGFLDRFKYGKIIKAAIIILLIWYYALLTGFSVAVCRAAVMVSMVIVGKLSARYINTLNILAVSAFLLLCYNPYYITEAGFQLSYLAVFGLIIFEPVIYKLFTFKNKLAGKLWKLCSLSIAIQLVIFPLCALYFHQFPVYFLISNLFVIVPAAVIMYTGALFLLLPQIPVVSVSLAFMLEKTIVLTNKVLMLIENSPWSGIDKIWLTIPECLLLCVLIISLIYFLYGKKNWTLTLSLTCGFLLCLSFSVKTIRQSQSKTIAWLNLNKHTGIIFKYGNEAVVLSDLRITDKTYQYSIQPYLDSCQVEKVNLYNLNTDINTPWLKKRYNLLQFLNTNIFIFDGQLKKNALSQKVTTNYIYITGNPDDGLEALNNNFVYNTLVIDGTNSDRLINNWGKQLTDERINYKILKRNKSIILVSN